MVVRSGSMPRLCALVGPQVNKQSRTAGAEEWTTSSLLSCSWPEEASLPPSPPLANDLLAWGRSSVSSTSSGPSSYDCLRASPGQVADQIQKPGWTGTRVNVLQDFCC